MFNPDEFELLREHDRFMQAMLRDKDSVVSISLDGDIVVVSVIDTDADIQAGEQFLVVGVCNS